LISNVIEISAGSFDAEVLEIDSPIVVEFFSHSCPHCIRFKSIYEELSEILKGQAKFFKIDVLLNKDNRALAHDRGIRSVPTLELFYRGRVIGSIVGYHHLEKIYETFKDFLAKKEEHIGPSTSLHSV
jgi:thioredoxin 1